VAGHDLAHAPFDHVLHARVEAADGAVDEGGGGDDVVHGPGMDLRDRDHEVVERVIVARHDRRHRLRHGDGGRDRIGGLVRHRAMAADAGDVDLERVDRGHDRPRRRQDLPQFQPRHVVDGIDAADAEAVHDALFAHHPGPAAVFLGGLEDQRDLAREIPRLGQVFRRPQQHRRVPVMAAGMHLARGGGGMRGPRRLHDRQRIHIGAQPDDRPLSLPFDDRHDPACRDPLVQLVDPELPAAARPRTPPSRGSRRTVRDARADDGASPASLRHRRRCG
jgi:hypothetical protein